MHTQQMYLWRIKKHMDIFLGVLFNILEAYIKWSSCRDSEGLFVPPVPLCSSLGPGS